MKSDWKKCTLEDLGEIVGGATPSTKNDNYYGGDVAWITPKDLSNFKGRFISHGERNITAEGLKNSSARLMPSQSVLFTSRAPIGYVAIAENAVCTNQGFKSIIPNVDTDYLFLYYLLVHNRDRIENMGSGTTFKEISGSVMKRIEVFVPKDKAEQQEIAKMLGALDDKIENNMKTNRHLEQIAQAIFKSWFVDFEPFGGEMPDNWRTVRLSEIVETVNGYSYKSDELDKSTIAMATIKNFERGGGFKLEGFKEIIPSGKIKQSQFVNLFETIVAHTDLTQKAEVVGNSEMLLSTAGYERIVASMDLVKVLPAVDGLTKFVLGAILRSPLFKEHCLGYVNGTTVLHLSKRAIPEYALAFPNDIAVLAELDALLEPIYTLMSQNIKESSQLITLRDTLLPRLMSGELSVADLGDAK